MTDCYTIAHPFFLATIYAIAFMLLGYSLCMIINKVRL